MSDKITKNYKVSASGIFYIDDNKIYISVEDKGDIALDELLKDFNNKPVKFSCSYDEDYTTEEIKVDKETGEII